MKEQEEHIVSPVIYLVVLGALMVLLVLTLAAAAVDLDHMWGPGSRVGGGYLNMIVALLIAVAKAALIVLFFMHLKYGARLIWAFAAAGFVWLGILIALSLSDYVTRVYPAGTIGEGPGAPIPHDIRPQPRHDAVVPGASARPIHPGFPPSPPLFQCDDA